MDRNTLNKSICSTCNKVESCSINKSKPVFFCEEFDNYANVQNKPEYRKEEIVKNNESEYTGLCINCDNRKSCRNRSNNIVIWHCEEYV